MTTQRTAASGTTPISQLFRDERMDALEQELAASIAHTRKLIKSLAQTQLMQADRIARLEGHNPSGILQRLANIELGTDHP